jgi:hypothetical protein
MLATIIIELSLLIYTYVRYKLNPITRVVMFLLFFLALFQLSEYSVCGRYNLDAAMWSRIGYVAITMLPPLGIHLIQLISGRGWKWIKYVAYANAFAWISVFATSTKAFKSHVCAGNYVIFQLSHWAGKAYFSYYYFWLVIGIVLSFWFALKAAHHVRESLILIIVGYIEFMLPTTIINNLYPGTRVAIPSIMCGFAVIYALMLVFGVVPLMHAVRPVDAQAKSPAKPDSKKTFDN